MFYLFYGILIANVYLASCFNNNNNNIFQLFNGDIVADLKLILGDSLLNKSRVISSKSYLHDDDSDHGKSAAKQTMNDILAISNLTKKDEFHNIIGYSSPKASSLPRLGFYSNATQRSTIFTAAGRMLQKSKTKHHKSSLPFVSSSQQQHHHSRDVKASNKLPLRTYSSRRISDAPFRLHQSMMTRKKSDTSKFTKNNKPNNSENLSSIQRMTEILLGNRKKNSFYSIKNDQEKKFLFDQQAESSSVRRKEKPQTKPDSINLYFTEIFNNSTYIENESSLVKSKKVDHEIYFVTFEFIVKDFLNFDLRAGELELDALIKYKWWNRDQQFEEDNTKPKIELDHEYPELNYADKNVKVKVKNQVQIFDNIEEVKTTRHNTDKRTLRRYSSCDQNVTLKFTCKSNSFYTNDELALVSTDRSLFKSLFYLSLNYQSFDNSESLSHNLFDTSQFPFDNHLCQLDLNLIEDKIKKNISNEKKTNYATTDEKKAIYLFPSDYEPKSMNKILYKNHQMDLYTYNKIVKGSSNHSWISKEWLLKKLTVYYTNSSNSHLLNDTFNANNSNSHAAVEHDYESSSPATISLRFYIHRRREPHVYIFILPIALFTLIIFIIFFLPITNSSERSSIAFFNFCLLLAFNIYLFKICFRDYQFIMIPLILQYSNCLMVIQLGVVVYSCFVKSLLNYGILMMNRNLYKNLDDRYLDMFKLNYPDCYYEDERSSMNRFSPKKRASLTSVSLSQQNNPMEKPPMELIREPTEDKDTVLYHGCEKAEFQETLHDVIEGSGANLDDNNRLMSNNLGERCLLFNRSSITKSDYSEAEALNVIATMTNQEEINFNSNNRLNDQSFARQSEISTPNCLLGSNKCLCNVVEYKRENINYAYDPSQTSLTHTRSGLVKNYSDRDKILTSNNTDPLSSQNTIDFKVHENHRKSLQYMNSKMTDNKELYSSYHIFPFNWILFKLNCYKKPRRNDSMIYDVDCRTQKYHSSNQSPNLHCKHCLPTTASTLGFNFVRRDDGICEASGAGGVKGGSNSSSLNNNNNNQSCFSYKNITPSQDSSSKNKKEYHQTLSDPIFTINTAPDSKKLVAHYNKNNSNNLSKRSASLDYFASDIKHLSKNINKIMKIEEVILKQRVNIDECSRRIKLFDCFCCLFVFVILITCIILIFFILPYLKTSTIFD